MAKCLSIFNHGIVSKHGKVCISHQKRVAAEELKVDLQPLLPKQNRASHRAANIDAEHAPTGKLACPVILALMSHSESEDCGY